MVLQTVDGGSTPPDSTKPTQFTLNIAKGEHGLFYATSPEITDLLVAKPTLFSLLSSIPQALEELHKFKKQATLAILYGAGDGDV